MRPSASEPVALGLEAPARTVALVDDLVEWIAEGRQPTGIQRAVSELVVTGGRSVQPVVTTANWWRISLQKVSSNQLDWPSEASAFEPTQRRPSRVLSFSKRVLPFRIRNYLRGLERALRATKDGLLPVKDGVNADLLLVLGAFWPGELPQRIVRLHGRGIPVRIVVYDTIPIDHPDWFNPAYCNSFRQGFDAVLPLAERIVTLSQHSAANLRRHYPEKSSSIRVATPTLAAHASRDRVLTPAGTPMLLAPGTVEPRKNHRLILDAWAIAIDDPRLQDARLVICGRRGWLTDDIEAEIAQYAQRRRIDRVERATDAELDRLYAASSATVHASVEEGLGLPPRESIVRGIPTLMSTLIPRDGLPDGTYELFDPSDAGRLARLIVDYLAEPQTHRPLTVGPGTGWEPVLAALVD